MSAATERLRRLLAEQLGECRDEDLERRLAELDDLETATPLSTATADAEVFAALGSETRYRLARLLIAAEDRLCVCELSAVVDVSDSAVSHALGDLVETGLAEREREGRWSYYRATDRAERLVTVLDAAREREGEGGKRV